MSNCSSPNNISVSGILVSIIFIALISTSSLAQLTRSIEFKSGVTIESRSRPSEHREGPMSVGSSEKSDRPEVVHANNTSASGNNSNAPALPLLLTTTSKRAIKRIEQLKLNEQSLKTLTVLGIFKNPDEFLSNILFNASSTEWELIKEEFKTLGDIGYGAISTEIEHTQLDLQRQKLQRNNDKLDATPIIRELQLWGKIMQALPSEVYNQKNISSVSNFQSYADFNQNENGKKGIKFYPKFTVHNALYSDCLIRIGFVDSQGNELKDFNNQYHTRGIVSVERSIMPSFRNSDVNANNFTYYLFMPYDELHIARGNHRLRFYYTIFSFDRNIYQSPDYEFTFSN